MNLQQTFSKILGREVTEDEAKDLASTQFGMLADYLRTPIKETENPIETNPEHVKLKSIFDLKDFHEFQNASEKLFLTEKLKANNFNILKTAEEIGIVRAHAYNLIDKYDIEINRGTIKD